METNIPKSEIEDVLVKYITGSATIEEQDTVRVWIEQNADNLKYYNQLNDIYISSKTTQPTSSYDVEKSWNKVQSRYFKKQLQKAKDDALKASSKMRFVTMLKYAAIFILAFGSGIVLTYLLTSALTEDKQQVWNEVEAPLGSRTSLILADGTQVWLNAGSKIRYPGTFNSTSREVYLEGEAYFKVTKSQAQKFVVKTTDVSVTAWGTEFNVKAYPEEKKVQTTLVEGVVSVKNLHVEEEKETVLKPNQSLTYVKPESKVNAVDKQVIANKAADLDVKTSEELILTPNISTALYTSWKDKVWIFEGEALKDLSIKLERRYNVKININSDKLFNYKFSGRLKEETLEQVLKIIKLTAPIDYTIKDNVVNFSFNRESIGSYE